MRQLDTRGKATLLAATIVCMSIVIAMKMPTVVVPTDEQTQNRIDETATLPTALTIFFGIAFVVAIFKNPRGARAILNWK